MPLSNLSPMDHKTQFIADFLRQSLSITELCLHYGISRKTAYKWINRYHQDSFSGLEDRSRKPKSCPHRYVSYNGGIRWNCDWVNVSQTCAGQFVGLEEIDNGIWNVYFGPVRLGLLIEEQMRIEDGAGKLWRHNKKV